MKKTTLLLTAIAASATLTSCFKDEPLNAECDIEQAYVHVDDPLTVFAQASDTLVSVLSNKTDISFLVNSNVDLSQMAPQFTLTPGATVSPASGTPMDYNGQQKHTYTVTSEDGSWKRTYTVDFRPIDQSELPTKYSFEEYETFKENDAERYHMWYETNAFGKKLDCWATGNAGFKLSPDNSNKGPEEYPSVAMNDGNGPKGSASGKYVKLETRYTGNWGKLVKRPIAAGNLFIGEFDVTKAMVATLQTTRFGKPFNKIPVKFSGWYKYTPAEKVTDKSYKEVAGAKDYGAIYAVLYRNHDDSGNAIVLFGNDVKTNKNIVAIADLGDIASTPQWTQFEAEFKWKDGFDKTDPEFLKQLRNLNGYSIAIVASSSKGGDEFLGAVGSTLCIDEFEITCE